MSEDSLKQIISKAIAEPEFRKLLLADPGTALSDYNLTEEEKFVFWNLSPEDLDALAGNLEERISRSSYGAPTWKNTAKCSGGCVTATICEPF